MSTSKPPYRGYFTRLRVRDELVAQGANEIALRDFDVLTESEFELWYTTCYEVPR